MKVLSLPFKGRDGVGMGSNADETNGIPAQKTPSPTQPPP